MLYHCALQAAEGLLGRLQMELQDFEQPMANMRDTLCTRDSGYSAVARGLHACLAGAVRDWLLQVDVSRANVALVEHGERRAATLHPLSLMLLLLM